MTSFTASLSRSLGAVALLCLCAQPAFAQETTPTEDQPESVFNMGEEVDENGDLVAEAPQPPQVGEQYLKEQFGDWALRCLKTADGSDPCQMYQLMVDTDGNAVAEAAVVALPNAGDAVAGATIVVPLETLLTEQLTLRVDGGTARRFPFNFCNVGGCVTRIGLTAEDLALFRRGAEATLTVIPAAAADQSVTVIMSLSGFTAAYNAVSQ